MWCLRLLAVCCLSEVSLAIVDYCDEFARNSSLSAPGIQFTKELSSSEYAVAASFKSLHCCAKGYRSIEWYKDGKAYPWGGDVSSFILYPESANRTVYSQALSAVDAGNYACRVTNDSAAIRHTARLTVFDMRKNYMEVPLPTYSVPAEQFVHVGEPARLFCEAFVGKIDLPDAENEVWWQRPGVNMSSPEADRYVQTQIKREDGQVVGAYLSIDRVRLADFGDYVCSISNTDDQVVRFTTSLRQQDWETGPPSHKIPWLKLQFVLVCVLVVALLVLVYNRFALSLLLYFKLKLSRGRPADDGKETDVLVCYAAADADFAINVLAVTLQKQYGHTVAYCQIHNARASAELQLAATLSRRLLAVVSPATFSAQWTPAAVCPLFRQLVELHVRVVCVTLKPLQEDAGWKCAEGAELRRLLGRCLTVTPWLADTPAQRRAFWTGLRLSLPPPASPSPTPSPTSDPTTATTTTNTTTRHDLDKSNESLEVLV